MVMDVAMVGCTWHQGTKHWWNGGTGRGGGRGRRRGGTFHGGTLRRGKLRRGKLRGRTLHGKTLQRWDNVEAASMQSRRGRTKCNCKLTVDG